MVHKRYSIIWRYFRNLPHLKCSFDLVTTLVLGHEQRSFTVLQPTNGRFSSIGRLSIVAKPSPLSLPHGGNTQLKIQSRLGTPLTRWSDCEARRHNFALHESYRRRLFR